MPRVPYCPDCIHCFTEPILKQFEGFCQLVCCLLFSKLVFSFTWINSTPYAYRKVYTSPAEGFWRETVHSSLAEGHNGEFHCGYDWGQAMQVNKASVHIQRWCVFYSKKQSSEAGTISRHNLQMRKPLLREWLTAKITVSWLQSELNPGLSISKALLRNPLP